MAPQLSLAAIVPTALDEPIPWPTPHRQLESLGDGFEEEKGRRRSRNLERQGGDAQPSGLQDLTFMHDRKPDAWDIGGGHHLMDLFDGGCGGRGRGILGPNSARREGRAA